MLANIENINIGLSRLKKFTKNETKNNKNN